MKIFKKIWFFLTPLEKRHAVQILIMIITMAFIDMMGVASILPFITVLTNPGIIETNSLLNSMFQVSSKIGIGTTQEFIFLLGIIVFIFLIFSLIFKALTIYIQTHFIQMRHHSIGKRLLENYIHQPYSWFLNRNSSDIGKTILSETGHIIGQGLTPISNLITHSLVSIFLIILLLLVDFKITLIVGFVIGGAYFIIFKLFYKFIDRIGKERLISNKFRFKFISEAFGATKEVKVGKLEKFFINRFSKYSINAARYQANSNVINQLPRYFIEAIAFGGMLLLILFVILKTGTFINSIPVITIYAFAGYRLIPSIQQIYQAIASLKFSNATVNEVYEDLKNLNKPILNQDQGILVFNKTIKLNHISYNYPNSSKTALKNINLTIPALKTVGLVGVTGCGKTSTVDVILGLLEPQKGTLEIDGKIITKKNLRSWQRSIGYVPQNIYLSDDTIAANIAFGVDQENINYQSIERAAKIANLDMFVINELPKKYQTVIGERGVRLSGGQRQRIGIARALYHEPKVLILDEATSALDNNTEQIVMDAINKLRKDLTIILIAHRLNTLKNCDIVFRFEKGQLVAQGTFDELFDNN